MQQTTLPGYGRVTVPKPRPPEIPAPPASSDRLQRACAMLVGMARSRPGDAFTVRSAGAIMHNYGRAARAALILLGQHNG